MQKRKIDMEGKFKKLIILFCIIVVTGFLIYWAGITAPKKEVILKKQLVEDIYTKEVLPWYEVYYKWNGKEQGDPYWMIFKTHKTGGEWKVVEVKDLYKIKNMEESPKLEEILKIAVKFDSKWINEYRFSPQLTRYQKILLLLTAQPTFSEEKDIFYKILDEIKEIEKIEK